MNISRNQFDLLLDDAIFRLERLIARIGEGEPAFDSIRNQLAAIKQWTDCGRRPSGEDKVRLTLDVLAPRVIGGLDPDLSIAIGAVANYLFLRMDPPTPYQMRQSAPP